MTTARFRWLAAGSLCVVMPVLMYSAVGAADAAKAAETKLVKPQTGGGMPLAEALAKRRSIRTFKTAALSPEQISQLCWAAQGVTDAERGLRTAPSALKLYAVRVYVVDANGAFEYLPQDHALRDLGVQDAARRTRECFGSEALRAAPMFVIIAMEPERLRARCGEKAERFSLLEVGHVCQNVLLQATAMGLGAVPAAGIDGARVAEALGLPKEVQPVYGVPVGVPAAE